MACALAQSVRSSPPPRAPCRSIKDRFGPAHSLSLYAAFFLGTSLNAAWLSVATAVQLLIALKLGAGAALEPAAVALAVAVTAAGAYALFREHDTGVARGLAGRLPGAEHRLCRGYTAFTLLLPHFLAPPARH